MEHSVVVGKKKGFGIVRIPPEVLGRMGVTLGQDSTPVYFVPGGLLGGLPERIYVFSLRDLPKFPDDDSALTRQFSMRCSMSCVRPKGEVDVQTHVLGIAGIQRGEQVSFSRDGIGEYFT